MDSIQPSNVSGGKPDKHEFIHELPIGDIAWIKKNLELFQKIKTEDPSFSSEYVRPFFMELILPFWDCMWDGITTDTGHVIYRLSDFVPQEIRHNMAIYPGDESYTLMYDGAPWRSLEDFRREWEKLNPIIPEFQKLLLGEIEHLLKPPS